MSCVKAIFYLTMLLNKKKKIPPWPMQGYILQICKYAKCGGIDDAACMLLNAPTPK